jgi:hypothetical protein
MAPGTTTIFQPQLIKQEQQQTIFTQSGLSKQNLPACSPNSSAGGSGPTSPLQVVPQAMESPSNINMLTQSGCNPLSSRNSGIQDLQTQHPKPLLMSGNGTFCTTGVSNSSTKKIILQPLTQPSNIILTSGGQPILLQATNQG